MRANVTEITLADGSIWEVHTIYYRGKWWWHCLDWRDQKVRIGPFSTFILAITDARAQMEAHPSCKGF